MFFLKTLFRKWGFGQKHFSVFFENFLFFSPPPRLFSVKPHNYGLTTAISFQPFFCQLLFSELRFDHTISFQPFFWKKKCCSFAKFVSFKFEYCISKSDFSFLIKNSKFFSGDFEPRPPWYFVWKSCWSSRFTLYFGKSHVGHLLIPFLSQMKRVNHLFTNVVV